MATVSITLSASRQRGRALPRRPVYETPVVGNRGTPVSRTFIAIVTEGATVTERVSERGLVTPLKISSRAAYQAGSV